MSPPRILFTVLALALLAACAPSPTAAPTIALPVLVLPSLTSTPPPGATTTPPPASPIPTLPPIAGQTTTQLNVRLEPSTGSTTLGMLPPGSAVQVVARDAGGGWYQILYSPAPAGAGWVSAAYVQVPDRDAVPILSAGGTGPSGSLLQQVNIRSGPGTSFSSLGTLNAGDVITLTARNPEGTWLQVPFPSGPEGRGWVAAAFVKVADASALPIVGGEGQVLGTGTPSPIPATPTATVLPAFEDGDSASAPGADLVISPSTAGAAQFSSDLSAPSGDTQDWVRLVSTQSPLVLRLECAGSPALSVDITTDMGAAIPPSPALECGRQIRLPVVPRDAYLVHLRAASAGSALTYTRYTLFINVVQ